MCGGLCAPVIRATWSDGPTHQGLPVSRWILKPKLRLADGINQFEGRVEICLDDQWGTICSNSWSSAMAQVVCTQLGYTINGSMGLFVNNGTSHMGRLEVCLGVTFGSVYDKNWSTAGASVVCRQLDHRPKLKDVICCGNETSIMECRCQQPGLIDSTCSTHSRDVSVLCIANNSVCSHGDVRLVATGSDREGRVEFCAGGE
ncbi:hypothetical protein EMCRGX_G031067 [Ephydatia muelleri]